MVHQYSMFDGHDPRWQKGKVLMKRMFGEMDGSRPKRVTMSDEEFRECQNFVLDVLKFSNFGDDNFEEVIKLLNMIRLSFMGYPGALNVPWRKLKIKHDFDGLLPMFVEQNSKCYVIFGYPDDLADVYANLEMDSDLSGECEEFTNEFVRKIVPAVCWEKIRRHVTRRSFRVEAICQYWYHLIHAPKYAATHAAIMKDEMGF